MHPARATDPQTSHEAADFMTASGKRAAQQELTAKAVEQYPGHTALEIATRFRMDRYMLGRRLSECERDGTVKRGPARMCKVSKRNAHTWFGPNESVQLSLPMAPERAA